MQLRIGILAFPFVSLISQVHAGWITFQNENKGKEGLPCIGSIYGNDNYLISHFDCGATDFNSTMCGIHCFPFTATTCTGRSPKTIEIEGLWYAPHNVETACSYIGDITQGNFTMAGPNVTSCGYIDWPKERSWGTVFDHPGYPVKTDGCWPVKKKPEPKFPERFGHFFDGARPYEKSYCEKGFAKECGPDEDPKCERDPNSETLIKCKKTDMPKPSHL